LKIGLVYRKDISSFAEIVKLIKEKAPYEFIDMGYVPSKKEDGPAQKEVTIKKLKKENPNSVIFIGPDSWQIQEATKPPKSINIVVDPTRKAPNLVHMGPPVKEALEAFKGVYPSLKKVFLMTISSKCKYSNSFIRMAKTENLETELVEIKSPQKLINKFAKRTFSKGDAILLVPRTESAIYPLIQTLVLLEQRHSIPVMSFSRNHVKLGVLIAYEKTPPQIAMETLAHLKRFFGKANVKKHLSQDPSKNKNKTWWYNSTVAKYLDIPNRLFEKINALPVFTEKTTRIGAKRF